MLSLSLLLPLFLLASFVAIVRAEAQDSDARCNSWASRGECTSNPAYMLQHCAASCAALGSGDDGAAVAHITSFFDLNAKDIHGKVVKFEQYRGHVTIVVNVASYCGYTESHYKGLVDLYANIPHDTVHILAFPCNQFGQQEPGTADEIEAFAKSKGVQFTLMEKIDVNGGSADIVYKYLKHKTQTPSIQWNFATYFVVGPDGTVTAKTGVEPMELKDFATDLLGMAEEL